MDFSSSVSPTATAPAAGAAPPITSPATPTSPASAVTDTQLLQLSLHNAVTAAALGKATVAANNYALVVKIFFRKCFLLEELVLLALAMGYDTRRAAASVADRDNLSAGNGDDDQLLHVSSRKDDAASFNAGSTASTVPSRLSARGGGGGAGNTHQQENKRELDSNNNNNNTTSTTTGDDDAQRVDPLANVGMLLPPGLDDDDYDEERTYYEQKKLREEEQESRGGKSHAHHHSPPPSSSSPTAQHPSSPASQQGLSALADGEDTPGYDAATARWLACLLAKVHPDALPIATLEKLCRVPIPSRATTTTAAAAAAGAAATTSYGASPSQPGSPSLRYGATNLGAATSNTNGSSYSVMSAMDLPLPPMCSPSSSSTPAARAYASTTVNTRTQAALEFPSSSPSSSSSPSPSRHRHADVSVSTGPAYSPSSTRPIAHLIPHLKSSPTAATGATVRGNVASPTQSSMSVYGNESTTAAAAGFGPLSSPSTSPSSPAAAAAASSSLKLLFATLLWDVACALWNEGYVEDTHHWLSVMDVRRLWKLYADSCVSTTTTTVTAAAASAMWADRSGGGVASGSALYASLEPPEEAAESDEAACALSWPAVLAMCKAADEPPATSTSRNAANHHHPHPEQQQENRHTESITGAPQHADAAAASHAGSRDGSQMRRAQSGITLSAFVNIPGPLPMTSPAAGVDGRQNVHGNNNNYSSSSAVASHSANNDHHHRPSKTKTDDETSTGGSANYSVSNTAAAAAAMGTESDFLTSLTTTHGDDREAKDKDREGADGVDDNNHNDGDIGKRAAVATGMAAAGDRKAAPLSPDTSSTASPSTTTAPTTTHSASAAAAAAAVADFSTAAHATPMFIRRLARRISALRDLCGLMMKCETAEDVFYVMYALHCAMQVQEQKMVQHQQQLAQRDLAGGQGKVAEEKGEKKKDNTGASVMRMSTISGGLAELLIVANLLVEFFLAKRAQKILLDSGMHPSQISAIVHDASAAVPHTPASTAKPFASTSQQMQQQQHLLSEHTRLVDRAVRQACDEVVCAFTNGQCLTLYGLESYGIPMPHDTVYGDGTTASTIGTTAAAASGGGGGGGNGGGVQLLASELPYVLVSNVLSSTLNYSTLYRLSKVFQGVMNARSSGSSSSSGGESGSDGEQTRARAHAAAAAYYEGQSGSRTSSTAAVVKSPQQGQDDLVQCLLSHPNYTHKATDEEKLRRRKWTRAAPPSAAAAHRAPSQTPQEHKNAEATAASAQSVVGELFGFMKGAAASWRNVASFVHPHSTDQAAQLGTPSSSTTSPSPQQRPPSAVHRDDVRPSQLGNDNARSERAGVSGGYGSSGTGSGSGGGGYAERIATARREQQEKAMQRSETTPLSAHPLNAAAGRDSSSLEGTMSRAHASITTAGAAARSVPSRMAVAEMQTAGPGACELLLPSHPSRAALVTSAGGSGLPLSDARSSHTSGANPAAAPSPSSSTLSSTVSLLAEENERMRVRWGTATARDATAATPPALRPQGELQQEGNEDVDGSDAVNDGGIASPGTDTAVLYTPSVQLQSRTPNEAASLRLLTLLYRYPQLHTLEPVAASHVDLVAKELNKALHILQVAMRGRFGEKWWLQWKARREAETQRYYARALADAQRGGVGTLGTSAASLSASTAADAATQQQQQPPSLSLGPGSPTAQRLQAIRQGSSNNNSSFGIRSSVSVRDTSAAGIVPPPAAPLPAPRQEPVLSKFWNTRTLSIPTDEGMRERRQTAKRGGRGASPAGDNNEEAGAEEQEEVIDGPTTTTVAAAAGGGGGGGTLTRNAKHSTGAAPASRGGSVTAQGHEDTALVVTEDGAVLDVDWDVPPAYTPEVSLDFSAFTTTSVETQEATRRLVESLQQQQMAEDDANANVPGISLLSAACRRLLHNELPLLLQYSPWRVIYSTRMHGVSLSTLFANCRREHDRHQRLSGGAFGFNMPMMGGGGNASLSGCSSSGAAATGGGGGGVKNSMGGVSSESKPMLLVLELPASTTLHFAEDDAGVREALAITNAPATVESEGRARNRFAVDTAAYHHHHHDQHYNEGSVSQPHSCSDGTQTDRRPATAAAPPYNKLYIGAFLSDLLRLESRRYYGTQDCFVFQLLVPGSVAAQAPSGDNASPSTSLTPQLRVFHASRQNAQFINCRLSSIVIGGGGSGSSLYLDDSLSHGATSACATFNSTPLSIWKAASTLCAVAGAQQPQGPPPSTAADVTSENDGRQHSLSVLNVEVIVVDN